MKARLSVCMNRLSLSTDTRQQATQQWSVVVSTVSPRAQRQHCADVSSSDSGRATVHTASRYSVCPMCRRARCFGRARSAGKLMTHRPQGQRAATHTSVAMTAKSSQITEHSSWSLPHVALCCCCTCGRRTRADVEVEVEVLWSSKVPSYLHSKPWLTD